MTGRNKDQTIAALLAAMPSSIRRESEWLLCSFLDCSLSWLLANLDHQPTHGETIRAALARLAAGEPLAYLTGRADFYGLELLVNRKALIPRVETEALIDTALALPLPHHARVVDLGCGSGALACALAFHRPQWRLDATDASLDVLLLAAANAMRLGLTRRISTWLGDWWKALPRSTQKGGYDLVATNPPYVAPDDPALDPRVARHEPPLALYAGGDGLAAYRAIFSGMAEHAPRATLVCEHGYNQGSAVTELAANNGLRLRQSLRDGAGHERVKVFSFQ